MHCPQVSEHFFADILQVQELLTETAKYVKDKEPTTLRYHLQRELSGDAPTFVMLET